MIGELAVILLQIARPEFLSGEIKRREIPGAVEKTNQLAVRHRRRRGQIAFVIQFEARRDFMIPKLLARAAIQGQRTQRFGAQIRGTDEDMIAPDDGRGSGGAGQRGDPPDVIRFGKVGREFLLGGRAVEMRPAPVRPVFRA